ncbi:MAG: hypothetical protein KDH08_07985, partial [Anaerolineae bacterium]|nr:hypothetical protein [Anaerolineae bacterium]MCB0238573.1 hypothetical protein [Anaerolineae bacterium]
MTAKFEPVHYTSTANKHQEVRFFGGRQSDQLNLDSRDTDVSVHPVLWKLWQTLQVVVQSPAKAIGKVTIQSASA